MPYNNTTPRFLIPFPDAGQLSSAAEEQKRELALEHPLEAALYTLTAGLWDGTIYDGFLVSAGAGLSISVAAGRGFIDGLAIYASGSTAKASLTDNNTLYIYLKKTATTPADRSFTVEQSLSGPPLANAILIATVTTAGGAVTAVDNSPASRAPRIRVPGLPRRRVVAPFGAEYSSPKTAIEACTAGDVVCICPGTYTITSTITIPADNIAIIGANRESTVLYFSTADANHCLLGVGRSGIRIEHLTVQAIASKTGDAIRFSATSNDNLIRFVKIVGPSLADGINFITGTRNSILYCWLTGAFSVTAIYLTGNTDNLIEGNIVETSATGAVYAMVLGTSHRARIYRNRISMTGAAPSRCVYIVECDDVEVGQNRITVSTPAAGFIALWIRATGRNCIRNRANNNLIIGAGDIGDGINLGIGAAYTLNDGQVLDNMLQDWANGINIGHAQVNQTRVHDNYFISCTAGLTDAGTGTDNKDNT